MGENGSAKKLRRLIVYRQSLDRLLLRIVKVNQAKCFDRSLLEVLKRGVSWLI